MSTLTDHLPGWFRRKGNGEEVPQESTSPAATQGATAGATTGGGSDQEPVVVWEAANLMEAQVVKGRLESEGIPAFIRGEVLGTLYGLTAGGLARADVLVPGPLAQKAVDLLFTEEGPEAEDGADDEIDDEPDQTADPTT